MLDLELTIITEINAVLSQSLFFINDNKKVLALNISNISNFLRFKGRKKKSKFQNRKLLINRLLYCIQDFQNV